MASKSRQLNTDDADDEQVREKEREKVLQDAGLLHTLATRPERILSPGKSLRAGLLSGTKEREFDLSSIEGRVEVKVYNAMHKAFWDRVRASRYRKLGRESVLLTTLDAITRCSRRRRP